MLRRRLRVTMSHHASFSIKAGLMARRFAAGAGISLMVPTRKTESGQSVSNLVQYEVAEPLTPIAQETQEAGIDEVSQKDAVARAHFRSDRIGRMPCICADGERITAVRHE